MSNPASELGLDVLPTRTKVTHLWRVYVAFVTTLLVAIVPLGFAALQANVKAAIISEVKPFLTIERWNEEGKNRRGLQSWNGTRR
jgi:hypothetical protein